MSNFLSNTIPLMQPVHYNGQVYFTSQYFHKQYRNNSGDNGKYQELKNFNKLIRSIETYQQYLDRGDIVELTRNLATPDFEPVFKANYGNPIMLINATAQVALTHHLDDEISKLSSVAVNSSAAAKGFEPNMAMLQAQMFILQSAGDMLRMSDTPKLRGLVTISKYHHIEPDFLPSYTDEKLTRALGDLLKENGSSMSAMKCNLILKELGYLEQLSRRAAHGDTKKFWSITETGLEYGKNETSPQNSNETQPRWYVSRFQKLFGKVMDYISEHNE